MSPIAWLRKRKYQKRIKNNCFHHGYFESSTTYQGKPGMWICKSWIQEEIVDGGRKNYWCDFCKRSWIL